MHSAASATTSAFSAPSAGSASDRTVDVRNVRKRFKPRGLRSLMGRRGVDALQGVDLSVYRGEIFGLLGPNGAGKSTLVKILLGLVRPTALEGMLLGAPVGRRETMARVGYLPEQHRFPPYLSGRQVVEFFSALAGLDRRDRKARSADLIDRVGMTAAADRRVNTYSKGMRQRIGLAQALAGSPELIILDEPTDGVDPVARRDIRDVLVEARRTGASVFVNSHLLGELELICDRVAILVNGKVARQGTIDELALGSEFYEIELAVARRFEELAGILNISWDDALPSLPAEVFGGPSGDAGPWRPPAPAGPGAAGAFKVRGRLHHQREDIQLAYDPYARTIRLETVDLASATAALDALRRADLMVRRFMPRRPSLEDLFFSTVTNADGTVDRPR